MNLSISRVLQKSGTVVIIISIILAGVVGLGAAAVGVGFSETIYVSYGDVEYEDSDLTITNYNTDGPGANIDEVHVTVENPTDEDLTAETSVWLLNDDEEISDGSETVTFEADGEEELIIDTERTRESQITSVDVVVEEE